MVRRIAAGAVTLVAAGGCSLAVSLDGFTGGGGGDAGAGTSASSSSSGSSSSDGLLAPLPAGVSPLKRSGGPTEKAIAFAAEKRVSLGFIAQKSWQLVEWRNLGAATEATRDFGNADIAISEPVQVGYEGKFYGTQRSQDGTVEVVEESAARSTIRTTFVHKPPGGSTHRATTTYAIYADGRIVEAVDYEQTSGSLPKVDYLEFAHTNVSADVKWKISVFAGGAGFGFERNDGGPACAIVAANHTGVRDISNDDEATNRFFTAEGTYSGKFHASWEYRFYGTAAIAEREAWVKSVGVAAASAAYDKVSGAFVVDAKKGTTASFELPAGVAWTGPAFAIDNWGGATLGAQLDGAAVEVIASRIGARVVVLYAGSVPAGAHTFSFSAP